MASTQMATTDDTCSLHSWPGFDESPDERPRPLSPATSLPEDAQLHGWSSIASDDDLWDLASLVSEFTSTSETGSQLFALQRIVQERLVSEPTLRSRVIDRLTLAEPLAGDAVATAASGSTEEAALLGLLLDIAIELPCWRIAARRIQRVARGAAARRATSRRELAAVAMQAATRACAQRHTFSLARRTTTRLQATWRGQVARRALAAAQRAASVLQAAERRRAKRPVVQALRRRVAAEAARLNTSRAEAVSLHRTLAMAGAERREAWHERKRSSGRRVFVAAAVATLLGTAALVGLQARAVQTFAECEARGEARGWAAGVATGKAAAAAEAAAEVAAVRAEAARAAAEAAAANGALEAAAARETATREEIKRLRREVLRAQTGAVVDSDDAEVAAASEAEPEAGDGSSRGGEGDGGGAVQGGRASLARSHARSLARSLFLASLAPPKAMVAVLLAAAVAGGVSSRLEWLVTSACGDGDDEGDGGAADQGGSGGGGGGDGEGEGGGGGNGFVCRQLKRLRAAVRERASFGVAHLWSPPDAATGEGEAAAKAEVVEPTEQGGESGDAANGGDHPNDAASNASAEWGELGVDGIGGMTSTSLLPERVMRRAAGGAAQPAVRATRGVHEPRCRLGRSC